MKYFMLCLLYVVGFKQKSVDIAIEWANTPPFDSKKNNAGGKFLTWQKKYPVCDHCTWPIVTPHDYCEDELARIAQEEEDDHLAAEAEWEYFRTHCHSPGCEELSVNGGEYCQKHYDEFYACSNCGKPESECNGFCNLEKMCDHSGCYDEKVKDGLCQYHWGEENLCPNCGDEFHSCSCDDAEDYDPRDDDEDICQGCDQPSYACTCAELASYRRFQADPATRGSWWTA